MKIDCNTDTGLDAKDIVVKKITSTLRKLLRKIHKKEMKFRVMTATVSITKGYVRPSEGWDQGSHLFTSSTLAKRRVRIRHMGKWEDIQ